MAILPDLRAAEVRLGRADAKKVVGTSTGAYLVAIGQAVQEALDALATSRTFVERPLRGAGGPIVPQTVAIARADPF